MITHRCIAAMFKAGEATMKLMMTTRTVRRLKSIVTQFSRLDRVDRHYILSRLGSDHAKLLQAEQGARRRKHR